MAKGRMGYVPKVVLDELENIKADHELQGNSEAYLKMVKFAQVGREIERARRDVEKKKSGDPWRRKVW